MQLNTDLTTQFAGQLFRGVTTLKTQSCHYANIVITGVTTTCYDKVLCWLRRQSWYHNSLSSVRMTGVPHGINIVYSSSFQSTSRASHVPVEIRGLSGQNAIQWNPSWKARNVSLKLQNSAYFHAPFFLNYIYIAPLDRPPLLKGHHLGYPL